MLCLCLLSFGDFVRQVLHTGNPFNQANCQNTKTSQEPDKFLQKGFSWGITDNDKSIEFFEIIGDVEQASHKKESEPGNYEIPTFSG